MEKKKKTKVIAGIVVLAVLILAVLCVNVYLKEKQNTQNTKYTEAQEEKKQLEEKQKALKEKQAEAENAENTTQEQQDSDEAGEPVDETEEDADSEESLTEEQLAEEDAPDLEAIRASVEEKLQGTDEFGEAWQIYVYRLKDGARASLGQGRLTAASLIKLYIMGAVYSSYDNIVAANGQEQVDKLLNAMITVSDNDSANTLVGMLGNGDNAAGQEAVNTYCKNNGYTDTSMGRMLLEKASANENYTSARDCSVFLKNIYENKLEHSEDMLNLLKQQTRTEKIPKGIPSGVKTANKTGELDHVENDTAIVFDVENPYIICVMADNLSDTTEARQRIVDISSVVYENISK